jgi:hypothetical protein
MDATASIVSVSFAHTTEYPLRVQSDELLLHKIEHSLF